MVRLPQVEVITSVERRRRFTDDEKIRIIEESLTPGASIAAVARRHDLAPRLLYMWKSRLKRAGLLVIPARGRDGGDEPSDFVQAASVNVTEENTVRVHLQDPLVVDFPLAIDPRHLAAVVRSLRD